MLKGSQRQTVWSLASSSGLQPFGGYIPPKDMEVSSLLQEDDSEYRERMLQERQFGNMSPAVFGVVFGYMLSYECALDLKDKVDFTSLIVFGVAIKGARYVNREQELVRYINQIDKLYAEQPRNYHKIVYLFNKVAMFDSIYRSGWYNRFYKAPRPNGDDVKPMLRALGATKEYLKAEEVLRFGVGFFGLGSANMAPSDCDLVTGDSLIDFKCSIKEPNNKHTFQLILYYLLGKHEYPEYFDDVEYLKIINPILGKVYSYEVKEIGSRVLKYIAEHNIGYSKSVTDSML